MNRLRDSFPPNDLPLFISPCLPAQATMMRKCILASLLENEINFLMEDEHVPFSCLKQQFGCN